MKHGWMKVTAATPSLRVADTEYNAAEIVTQARRAAKEGSALCVFPELCLTGYTCGDLFLQQTLLDGALAALETVREGTEGLDMVVVVGLPLRDGASLYNCAAVLCGGEILGIVPKQHLPNYAEFYEARHFTSGSGQAVRILEVLGREVFFGADLLFTCRELHNFVLGVEICEDLWTAGTASARLAEAGATVIANLSASNELAGKGLGDNAGLESDLFGMKGFTVSPHIGGSTHEAYDGIGRFIVEKAVEFYHLP